MKAAISILFLKAIICTQFNFLLSPASSSQSINRIEARENPSTQHAILNYTQQTSERSQNAESGLLFELKNEKFTELQNVCNRVLADNTETLLNSRIVIDDPLDQKIKAIRYYINIKELENNNISSLLELLPQTDIRLQPLKERKIKNEKIIEKWAPHLVRNSWMKFSKALDIAYTYKKKENDILKCFELKKYDLILETLFERKKDAVKKVLQQYSKKVQETQLAKSLSDLERQKEKEKTENRQLIEEKFILLDHHLHLAYKDIKDKVDEAIANSPSETHLMTQK